MAIAGFDDLDFDDFHRNELPRRLSTQGEAAAGAVRDLGSLALQLPDGRSWTYVPGDAGIDVSAGDTAADTVIGIDHESWEGLVHDYESAPGLLYGGRVRCVRGRAMKFVGWEPALRAMFQGRPIYDPAEPLPGANGGRLDPEQSFRLDADREEMAHFLRTAGYLFVRGVFDAAELAGFKEEAAELRGEAVKGDKLSWWGRNGAGEEILCRVTRAADKPRLATLRKDPRIQSLVALSDETLVPHKGEGNGVTVIYKNPDMAEGLSDIPWHRDCGMGGHATMCPVLLFSLYLTPANPRTGELAFLPGSWKAGSRYMDADASNAHAAHFDAAPGDVSIHYGDVMHAAPPPTGRDGFRMSAVFGYGRPDAYNHLGQSSYNEVLHGREDGQVDHLAKVASRS